MRELNNKNEFISRVSLSVGRHKFKFMVDGEWTVSFDYIIENNNYHTQENILEVYPASIE
jgi:hypothetical protein